MSGQDERADAGLSDRERYERGMTVRREVLSDAHVDRAIANTTPFTAGFQDYITRVAWGDIWSRPGLDRRSRSIAVLTAMIALGHHEEFEMHVRAALRNGLTVAEIEEVILQAGLYCGVPAANTAFRLAGAVLAEAGVLGEAGSATETGAAETGAADTGASPREGNEA